MPQSVPVMRSFSFVHQTNTTHFAKIMESWNVSLSKCWEMIADWDEDKEHIERIQRDPYFTSTYQQYSYTFSCDPVKVIAFYEKHLASHGWQMYRTILFTEYTNSGGDWLHVYRKNNDFLRIHIYGSLSAFNPNDPGRKYQIDFDFIDDWDEVPEIVPEK